MLRLRTVANYAFDNKTVTFEDCKLPGLDTRGTFRALERFHDGGNTTKVVEGDKISYYRLGSDIPMGILELIDD